MADERSSIEDVRAWAETLTREQLVDHVVRCDWYQRTISAETARLAAAFRAEIDALSARYFDLVSRQSGGGSCD